MEDVVVNGAHEPGGHASELAESAVALAVHELADSAVALAVPEPPDVQHGGPALSAQPSNGRPLPESASPGFDVLVHTPQWHLKAAELLLVQGFCVIDASNQEEVDLCSLGGFAPEPGEPGVGAFVAEGLLGREGSMHTRSLPDGKEKALEAEHMCKGLEDKDQFLLQVAEEMAATLPLVVVGEDPCRTSSYIHKAARPGLKSAMLKPAKLSRQLALDWMNIFTRARLMIVLFLGPGSGTLELGLLDKQSSEKYRVPTRHGVMVMLRPELLSRNHRAETCEPAFALSCFILNQIERVSDQDLEKGKMVRTPYIETLRQFILKDAEDGLGRSPKSDMGPRFQVKSDACNLQSIGNSDSFFGPLACGVDLVSALPWTRFNYDEYFDQDLTAAECCRKIKSYSKHASFIEGTDFFSANDFSVTNAEAEKLHPFVRTGLEVAREAAERADFPMKGDTCRYADVLVALDEGLERIGALFGQDPKAIGSEEVPSLAAFRIPVALGLTGRNTVVDTDASSSLVGLSLAMKSWRDSLAVSSHDGHREQTCTKEFSLVLGTSVWKLEPWRFVHACARGLLSSKGRCFCFTEGGLGYVRAEGCAAVVLTAKAAGAQNGSILGDLRSAAVVTSGGRSASLTQRASVVMEAAMDDAVIQGRLAETDISVVECSAPGAELTDAAEAAAIAKVFPLFLEDEVVKRSATKSNLGSGEAAAGLFALVRVLAEVRQPIARSSACNHLKVLSPSIDFGDVHGYLPCNETTQGADTLSTFACINSFGHGGTCASAIVRGEPTNLTGRARDAARSIFFWPAGGGELKPYAVPKDGYFIAGSFNEWDGSQRMQEVEPGVWEAVIVLGDYQWESFQIWIDGERNRALNPRCSRAGRMFPVSGPDECEQDMAWQIGGPLSGEDGGEEEEVEVASSERGEPGDRYRVQLYVAGKFRKVDWANLGPLKVDGAVVMPTSTYYVAANWNRWVYVKMTQDPVTKGLWSYTADLKDASFFYVFHIVRNKDPNYAFYPEQDDVEDPSVKICGPSNNIRAHCWRLDGSGGGKSVKIEFQRTAGFHDDQKVTWTYLPRASPSDRLTDARRQRKK